MSGTRKSGVLNLDSHELSALLYRHGVSSTGINSIRDNGITGEMFHDFCEEDIKDAFTVFKDRFIVRKLLREFKAPSVSPTKRSPEAIVQMSSSPPSTMHRPHHMFPMHQSQRSKRPWSSVEDTMERHYDSRSVTDAASIQISRQFDSNCEPLHTTQVYKNVSSANGSKFQKSSADLMYQTVSSSNEALSETRRDAVKQETSECVRNVSVSYYPVKSETNDDMLEYANQQIDNNIENQNREHFQDSDGETPPLVISEIRSNVPDDNGDQGSAVGDMDTSRRPENEKHDFMMNLVSSTICQFTPEQLLEKKSVRGRPSEAQRLGTVLIRSAAQSAKIWNSAPLLKDIPHEQKEIFMKHVLTSTPQLSTHVELVWTRLREALQNRRKYLLDKECGKRVLKGRFSGNSSTDELIDLTQIPSDIDINNIKREME